jgi:CubicO group peptidase (beta-lactamase class C family)
MPLGRSGFALESAVMTTLTFRLALAAAVLATLIGGLRAQRTTPTAATSPDPRFDRVVAALQEKMTELGIPGVALGVLADGEVRTRGFGVTNVDHPLPVTDDTLFQIGSISKTFTGTAIMRLVERNQLRLDDPIRKHLPNFKVKDAEASARATVRDALTHMGGWEGDFFDDPSSGDDALQRIVERMTTLEQTAKVGEMWGYNNAGFYLAGRVIEVVTGKPFERALRELVLDPIGLETAYFFPADVMTRRFAVGHGAPKGQPAVIGPWPIPRAANAAGGITTNVASMLRYAAFHMSDGTARGAQVLSPSSLQQMRSAIVPKAGTDLTMGLTWHLSRAGNVTVVEHGGGTNGQISQLRLVPERQWAVAIVTNSGRGSTLNTHVLRAAMDAYLGIAPVRPLRMAVDAAALQEYVGTYRRQFADVSVTVDGDALKMQVTPKMPGLAGVIPPAAPPQRLGFFAKDRLLRLDGPDTGEAGGEFIRGANGRVEWLRTGRIHKKVDRSLPTR